MGPLGALALLAGFGCLTLARKRNGGRRLRRMAFLLLLLVVHLVAAAVYHDLAITHKAGDAWDYYHNPRGVHGWGLRTQFIVWITQGLRVGLGASLWDCFLAFQLFGLAGAALLVRSLDEVYSSRRSALRSLSYSFLLLPGIHFWTVAPGKDAPVFFGLAISTWAILKLRSRRMALALGLSLVFVIRPHVAAVAVAAFAIAVAMGDNSSKPRRALALACSGTLLLLVSPVLSHMIGADELTINAASSFVQRRHDHGFATVTGPSLLSLPLPLRAASLLFRPLFFDASGFMGWAASLESLSILLCTCWILIRHRTILSGRHFAACYSGAFVATLVTLLALIHYNVGGGLRQRIMIMPGLLLLTALACNSRRLRDHPDFRASSDGLSPLRLVQHRSLTPEADDLKHSL